MKMMKSRYAAWGMLAGLLLSPLALAQEQPDDYAQQLPLTLSGEGPWYRLDVPMADA